MIRLRLSCVPLRAVVGAKRGIQSQLFYCSGHVNGPAVATVNTKVGFECRNRPGFTHCMCLIRLLHPACVTKEERDEHDHLQWH